MKNIEEHFKDLGEYINEQSFDYELEIASALENCPSRMDAYDLIFSLIFGSFGAMLNTNEEVKKFLDKIHEASNSDNPHDENIIIDFFAKLLKHKGDWMDQVPVLQEDGSIVSQFVNRSAKEISNNVWISDTNTPHRIFWGHDILSFGPDNPFWLEIKQYGFLKGVFQAIRHLLADLCSTQGIPIPTSSWWDYIQEGSDGAKRGNRLLDFCQTYAKDVLCKKERGADNAVFNNLFSIHMQDVLSKGFVNASVGAYCKARSIADEERIEQIRLIAFTSNFLGSSLIGAIKTKIPHVNWVCLAGMTKSVFKLVKTSNKNINSLWCKTETLISETDLLEERVISQQVRLENDIVGLLSKGNNKQRRSNLIDNLGGNKS